MRHEFDFDVVNVIDLEATCWKDGVPAGQRSEIIEVGIVELEMASGDLNRKTSIIVKPTKSEVSDFCSELTGISPAQAAAGISFAEACMRLRKEFASRERVWASWGDYDRVQFERQCKEDEVPYPFGRTHLNVMALANLKWGRRFESIAAALAVFDGKFEGRLHSGADDAHNIARVLRRNCYVCTIENVQEELDELFFYRERLRQMKP